MPTTRTIRDEFSFDKSALRYRRNGRFVSERAMKLGIRRVIRTSQAEMRDIANQMARGEITVADFQARLQGEMKNLHVSGAMAGQGGPANMTREDYLRVGRKLRMEYKYLGQFAEQIARGELTASQIRQRTEMRVRSMNGAYEGGRQATAMAQGYLYERNLLGNNENHCHATAMRQGCRELTARGWVAIGTMPLPGSRVCLSNCGCSLKFKR